MTADGDPSRAQRPGSLARPATVAATYPPEPWQLTGRLLLSVLRVPERSVPRLAGATPHGHRPLRLGGDVLLGLALVHYAPGGVLSYDELLAAVLTVPAGRPRAHVTIPRIWVTSAESAAGGRELWAIPKERCDVVQHATDSAVHAEVSADGAPVAGLTARLGPRLLPGRLPLTLTTAQRALSTTPARDGERPPSAVVSDNRLTTEVRAMRARWTIEPDGPLGHLAGRRPLISLALTGATIVFGHHVERKP